MDQKLPKKPSNQSLVHSSVQGPSTLTYHPPRLQSMMTCGLMGCLLSAIGLLVASFAGLTFAKNRFEKLVCDIPVIRFCHEEPGYGVGLPTIDEIRAVGWLETLEVDFSTTVKVTNRRGTKPFQADEVLTYNACGRTAAGVDLERLDEQDVKISKTVSGDVITYTIAITLPQAEVLAVNPADGTFTIDPVLNVPTISEYPLEEDRSAEILLACNDDIVWDVPSGFDKTPSLMRDAEEQAMIQFRAFAEEGYVLDLAQQNAKSELERFLKLAGYKDVIFAEPEKPVSEPEGLFERLGQSWGQIEEILTPEPEDEQ
jgi:hypothetical protein